MNKPSNSRNIRLTYVLLSILGFLMIAHFFIINRSVDKGKKIVIINSYGSKYPKVNDYRNELQKEFEKSGTSVQFKTFYLDCENRDNDQEIAAIDSFLSTKEMKEWNPDLIITTDDQATYSALMTHHPLMKQKPVLFGGVNYPNWPLLREYKNVTGFYDRIDFKRNFEVIEDFKKYIHNEYYVFVFLDNLFLQRKVCEQLIDFTNKNKNQFELIDNRLPYSNQEKRTNEPRAFRISDLKLRSQYITQLKQTPIVITGLSLGHGFDLLYNLADKDDVTAIYLKTNTLSNVERAERLCHNLKFSTINELFGCQQGFTAGYFSSHQSIAQEMAGVALRIFNGTNPSTIPIKLSAKDYWADWEMLSYHQIDYTTLPHKYNVVNIPFRVQYSIHMQILATLIILVILASFIYLFRTRNNAMKQNQQSSVLVKKQKKALYELNQERISTQKELNEKQEILNQQSITLQQQYETMEKQNQQLEQKNQQLEQKNITLEKQKVELEHARDVAEKAEMKQSFLANMSHEIRTPLNAIVGFSNLLSDNKTYNESTPEEIANYRELINTNSDLLLKLVNDILDLSRIESGVLQMDIDNYDAISLMKTIFDNHKVIITNVKFALELNDSPNCQIKVDKFRFIQVVTNFLANSKKFTHEGQITLGYRFDPALQKAYFYVSDTGIGIADDQKKLIFSRFYKTNEFAQGTGLGLAICTTIIDRFNGNIELDSTLGKGSTFTIVLPAKPIQ